MRGTRAKELRARANHDADWRYSSAHPQGLRQINACRKVMTVRDADGITYSLVPRASHGTLVYSRDHFRAILKSYKTGRDLSYRPAST